MVDTPLPGQSEFEFDDPADDVVNIPDEPVEPIEPDDFDLTADEAAELLTSAPQEQIPVDVIEEGATRAVKYCTVRFTVGWLPSSVGFTDAAKAALANDRGVDKRVIRGSYAILGASRDALIKQGHSLRGLLATIRDEYTIPEFTIRATAVDDKPLASKVHGSYIIESIRIEQFLTRFEEVRQQYLAWGRRFMETENYNRIRAADMEALADDWAVVEKKYPSAEALADSISCDVPKIAPFDASFTLADVAPATVAMLQSQARERLDASIDGAMSELLLEFREMVGAVAKNCGTRVRILPDKTGEFAAYRNAEVVSITRTEDDESVPVGSLLLELQKVKIKSVAGKDDKFNNEGAAEKILVTQEVYTSLGPYETQEYRQLTQSAFDNLMWLTQKITTVKSLLHAEEESDGISSLVDDVQKTLTNLGKSAADITKAIKGSEFARTSAKSLFDGLHQRIVNTEVEVKTRNNVRRRSIVGGPASAGPAAAANPTESE